MAAPFASQVVGRGKYLRAPKVRQGLIGIEITNLRSVERLPDELSLAFIRMMFRLQHDLEAMAKANVPGSPEGRLGRTVQARKIGNRVIVGTFGSEFAAALDRGFTATPKKGKALRFSEGGQVYYRKRVRVAGKHFFAKWVALAPAVVEEVYTRSFYDVKRAA